MTSKITLETVNSIAHGAPLEGGFYGGVITIPNATNCYDSMANTRAMAGARCTQPNA